MRKGLWLLLFFSCLFVPGVALGTESESSPVNDLVRKQLDQLQTEEVEAYWKELQAEYGQFFPEGEVPSLFDLVLGKEKGWTLEGLLKGFLRFFFQEILYNGKLLGTIIVLTVFSIVLSTLQSAFEGNQVSKVAYAVVFLVVFILAINSFSTAVESANTAISRMVHFMLALIPLVFTLLASMGSFTSVGLFHPLIVFMIHTIGTLIYTIIFPLLFFSAVLSIVSSLSDKYKVNQLADLLRRVGIGILGGLITIFLGIISVQGATAAVTDGITVRTAKYVTGNFVPVVGRMFSDAADTVVGASLLMKNAVGVAGVMILLLISAFPALKILSLALIYNFSAAVMQPLGDSPVIYCLNIIGKTLLYVFAALATVGLMFFLAITLIVTAGNISVMMR